MTVSSVEVSPSDVDAGADISLDVEVSCSSVDDGAGTRLLIKDHDGRLAASVGLAEFDGEAHRTGALVVAAPLEPGTYTWSAVCAADTAPDVDREQTPATFSFTVHPHKTRVLVWNLPSAVQCGDTFSIKLGVKCSSRCRANGWALEVRDHEQNRLATARLGDDVWPETAALYYAEIDLKAPDMEGLYRWEVRAPGPGLEVPHAESVARLNVRVVPTPDCVVTVEAIDLESLTPVEGAKVVVHPYRAFTDERGMAEVKVPKGKYRLFVSGRGHFPFQSHCEVNTDMTIRAQLALDPEPSDADIWS